jgi:hypothetical protein
MSQRDVVIRVEGVSKLYRLGEVGMGSLAHDVNRWWHKVRWRIASLLEVGTGFHPELTEPSEVSFALHGPSREPQGWPPARRRGIPKKCLGKIRFEIETNQRY